MIQAQNLTDVLNSSGLAFTQLCSMFGTAILDTSLFCLSDLDHARYHELFSAFDQSRNSSDREKGATLEELCSFLLSKLGMYQVLKNKRTSTNEMDVVLIRNMGLPITDEDLFPRYMICECKNYGGSVSVTYVGKFYSLLKVSDVNLGLMISDEKISGRTKWNDGCGLCRKIALRDKTYIVNISYDDLKLIDKENVSILQIIYDKISAIKLDISISYTNHELCEDSGFISKD